jgi:hypothetical protein
MNPQEQAMPPGAAILNFITGMWTAQALAAAAGLGVADHLADGPKTADQLAPAVNADAPSLYRLMRALSSVGIFAMSSEGRFSLTPLGDVLRSNVPGSMRSMLIAQMAPGHWLPWGKLETCVRTGKPVSEAALGMSAWEHYKRNPEEGNHFAAAMTAMSSTAMQAVLVAYSFAGATKVVDVGGSHGSVLAAVLQCEPSARGVLFDLPHVVEGAVPLLESTGVAGRVERVAGSFFESVPKGGDVYLLKHILHDWPDDDCVKILRNIATAMAPGGRVAVIEFLIADSVPMATLMDLNMMVLVGGKERTSEEFGALFAKAGLRLASVTPTASPFAVLEARRA